MEDFAKDIAAVGSIAAVPTILDVVCRTTGMGFAAVARVTDGRWITCGVLDHIQFGLKPGDELEVETTICHEIRQVQEPVIIDHVAEDETYRDHHTPRMYGFQSYISMPIFLSGGRFFGTLCAIDPRPARLNTPEIIGMFRLFAELIASHLDSIQKLAVSESLLLEEREVSELREQFIAVLGHDLRNPLNAISMGAMLLKETTSPKAAPMVDLIQKSVVRMSDLIEDVMDFARGRLGGGIIMESMTEQPLQPLLEHVISEMRAIWPERAIEIHYDLGGTIRYDQKRFSQLFTNLLANAMAHGHAGHPVVIRAINQDRTFSLSVSNASEPIPAATLERLFEPFSRGDAEGNQQGLGLGLYIASQIAKSHGGSLEASSDETETRFTFVMPTG